MWLARSPGNSTKSRSRALLDCFTTGPISNADFHVLPKRDSLNSSCTEVVGREPVCEQNDHEMTTDGILGMNDLLQETTVGDYAVNLHGVKRGF